MKRFGEKAVREAIANGAIVRAWDWYTLEAGYRVIIDDETAGYIVSDLFFKLKNDGTIKKDHWAHSYTDYKAAEEITAEEATQEASFRVCFHENGVYQRVIVEAANAESARAYVQHIQPAAVVFAVKLMAGEPQKPGEPTIKVPADFIPAAEENAAETEKTAEEWAAESERVQEATAAALAAVIATEEAPAEEEATEPEYLEESWPRSNSMPGISYILEWSTPGSTTHHTAAETVEDLESHIQQIKNQGGRISKAVRWDKNAGKFREFIPETRQEKTDRENWEHCKRIAEGLEAYAAGNAYKCPHCDNVHPWEEYEEFENEDGETCYTCPHCEQLIYECDLEQLTLYDYFNDCLDIEYRCSSDKEYRSVCIMVACGGPNIYIDTAEKAVLLYWWTDRARYYLSSEAVEAVDEWAEEYWNCL